MTGTEWLPHPRKEGGAKGGGSLRPPDPPWVNGIGWSARYIEITRATESWGPRLRGSRPSGRECLSVGERYRPERLVLGGAPAQRLSPEKFQSPYDYQGHRVPGAAVKEKLSPAGGGGLRVGAPVRPERPVGPVLGSPGPAGARFPRGWFAGGPAGAGSPGGRPGLGPPGPADARLSGARAEPAQPRPRGRQPQAARGKTVGASGPLIYFLKTLSGRRKF